MAKISFVRPEDTTYVRVRDLFVAAGEPAEAMRAKVPDAEQLHQEVRYYFPGGTDELQLFEVRCDPDVQFHAHAHDEDEIIFVLEGEIQFGAQKVAAGGAVYVPAATLYAFRSGSEPLRFLNFRPRADGTYITRDELSAARQEATQQPS